ncbi:hypothetical protein [Allomuricauda sp. F6463D]|uniref:hypothetical protein n=1 Tax=Allomuricauda sp. F6463D TaxID=2926409 RepID=UPI001FF1BB05|nr:hypothetical protein [Muricauda sp. F6463D]MCK0160231.1 hypothetical protein [Muricauda sp. F6463D]
MRKFILLALCSGILFSCSDGDLEIETIDFDSVSLEYCSEPTTDSKNLLFKINDSEALILELQSGVLNNGEVGETVTSESTVPSQSQVTYRIFSDTVDDGYFCDDVPPAEPTVVTEVEAEGGQVIVETVIDPDDATVFVHTISLSGISFVTESGERITNLAISEFGDVTTNVPD